MRGARSTLGWAAAWVAGVALFVIFPGANPLRLLGAMLIAGATLILLVRLGAYLVRSLRRDGLSVKNGLLAAIVLLVALFVVVRLAGPGDEAQIEDTIRTVALSDDASICTEEVTERYLRQTTGYGPPFGDDLCKDEANESTARAVEVAGIDVDGERAEALVAYRGGGFAGSTVRVGLAKVDGAWKLDRIVGFERFDRAKMEGAYARQLLRYGMSAAAADCALRKVRGLPARRLERSLLTDAPADFASIAVECDRDRVERSVTGAAVPEGPHPLSTAKCIEERAAAASDAELARLNDDPVTFGRLLYDCDRATVFADQERQLREGDLSPEAVRCVSKRLRALPPNDLIRLFYDEERYQAVIDACEG